MLCPENMSADFGFADSDQPTRHVSLELERLRRKVEGLEGAMHSRASIEQAKGILMARYGVDDATAFSILRRWSMTANLKIRDLAVGLIEVTTRPSIPAAHAEAVSTVRDELGL